MVFKELLPEPRLQPYIKCFYLYESDSDRSYDDIVFPSGTMEVIFNLGAGNWRSKKGDTFFTTPPVELWGQITKPLAIQSVGRNIMLGFRFYPHSAAYFFDENVSEFNNEIVDATHVFGPKLRTLYLKLLETADLNAKVAMIEDYLRSRLSATEKSIRRSNLSGILSAVLKRITAAIISCPFPAVITFPHGTLIPFFRSIQVYRQNYFTK